jgi:hypothetical protein
LVLVSFAHAGIGLDLLGSVTDEALYRTLDYTISYLASGNRILFAEVPAV